MPGWALMIMLGVFLVVLAIGGISYFRRQKTRQQARVEMDHEIAVAQLDDPILNCPMCRTRNNVHMSNCVNCGGPLGLAAAMAGAGAMGAQTVAGPQTFEQIAPDPPKTGGVIKHDVVIGGQVAFPAGAMVNISQVSPDPSRPEYKYVVQSDSLGKSFRLSDNELMS